MSDVALIVPFSPGDDVPRNLAWQYVRQRYCRLHPALHLVVGVDPIDGDWSKGRAAANGVARSSEPILVIADADVIVPVEALGHAILAVMHGAAWSMPHGNVYRLSRRATDLMYREPEIEPGIPNPRMLDRLVHEGPAGGGMVVLTRSAFEATGGIDPRFIGFGGDDISWACALNTLVGPCERFRHPMIHLWHPRTARRHGNRGSVSNEALAARYGDANGDEEAMRLLIKEHAA